MNDSPVKDPWRFNKSINQKTHYETDLEDYSIYVMSRSLSYHQNILQFLNLLNICGWIDKELHYDFMFYGLPKEFRRVSKWSRPEKYDDKTYEVVKEYYNFNSLRANEAMKILTEEQLEEIVTRHKKE